MEAALKSGPAEEWEALFNEAGVPSGSVLTVPQILNEDQITGRKFVESLPATVTGGQPIRVTRPGFRLDADYPEPCSAVRNLGNTAEQWLHVIGYSPDESRPCGSAVSVTYAKSADREGIDNFCRS